MFGQRNLPSSSRLANRHTPVPSQKSALPDQLASLGDTYTWRPRTDRPAWSRAPAPPDPRRPCEVDRLRRHQHPNRARRTNHVRPSRSKHRRHRLHLGAAPDPHRDAFNLHLDTSSRPNPSGRFACAAVHAPRVLATPSPQQPAQNTASRRPCSPRVGALAGAR